MRNRRTFLKETALLSLGAPLLATALDTATHASGAPTAPSLCPKSKPPADTLWAIRAEGANVSRDERLTLSCLQGLVNRQQPRIYIAYDRYDELWLDWLRQRGNVKKVRWVEPADLYREFLAQAKGLVVTDPGVPGSANVATMLAGVEGWLPVVPSLREKFPGLGVAMDLRERKWEKNIQAYRWFYGQYGEQMSRRACASYDPAQSELRDYFVEFNVPMIWVSHPKDAEKSRTASWGDEEAFARELFEKLPPNIPCLGWWDHGLGGEEGCGENGPYSGLDLACQYGKFEVCSGFDGFAPGVGNLSVHSGTCATFRQQPAPPPPSLMPDKVYYTYTRTDGDGPNFWRQVYRQLWDQPDHGQVPVGWQLGPAASELIPDIIDYFYQHATPGDVFVNALTGAGYIHENCFTDKLPKDQQEQVWKEYIGLSRNYMRRLDLSLLTTFEAHELMPPQTLARFAGMPEVKAIYRNYARLAGVNPDNAATEINGVPVFRALLGGSFTLRSPEEIRQAAGKIAGQIRDFAGARRPGFLHVSLTNWFLDMRVLPEIEKALGPDYVAVRPDHLPVLYKRWRVAH